MTRQPGSIEERRARSAHPLSLLTSVVTIGAALAVTSALIAGCSSNSIGTSHTSSSTTSTEATITTSSSTTAAPTTTVTSVATCLASNLNAKVSGTTGAAGTHEVTVSLKNNGASTCSLDGYPGAQLLDASGNQLTTTVLRGGGLSFENVAAADVVLHTGDVAYFNIGYSDVTTGSTACSNATQLWVTPPNDTEYVTIPATIRACNNGTLNVSPVFSSTSAGTQTTAPPGN